MSNLKIIIHNKKIQRRERDFLKVFEESKKILRKENKKLKRLLRRERILPKDTIKLIKETIASGENEIKRIETLETKVHGIYSHLYK